MRRHYSFSFLIVALVATWGMQASVPAAMISSITTMPLNRTSDNTPTYIAGTATATAATYTKPNGLVVDMLTTNDPRPNTNDGGGSRTVRASTDSGIMGNTFPRNNAQTFTIDGNVYPFGVDATALAIQFEQRGNLTGTFTARLFKVVSGNANAATLVEPVIGDILLSTSGLQFPTFDTLVGSGSPSSTNNGASGTAIFHLDDALTLEPGVYAFQFQPTWTTASAREQFDWAMNATAVTYAAGANYEYSVLSANPDQAFGVIGTIAVPEPSAVVMLGIGALAITRLRHRK